MSQNIRNEIIYSKQTDEWRRLYSERKDRRRDKNEDEREKEFSLVLLLAAIRNLNQ